MDLWKDGAAQERRVMHFVDPDDVKELGVVDCL